MQQEHKIYSFPIEKFSKKEVCSHEDLLAVEEPLEIRLDYYLEQRKVSQSISITMRTPGDDFDLALGFLFSEGIIVGREDVAQIQHCGPQLENAKSRNIVKVALKENVNIDIGKLQRNFYTTSSCGVCGKASIEALKVQNKYSQNSFSLSMPQIQYNIIHSLAEKLQNSQEIFAQTGGVHASGLFDLDGCLQYLCEDVGRHNAVDKLLGVTLQEGILPLENYILVVSGRLSFELIQKASMGGIRIVVAVGAPSSLAVELAKEMGITLIGFVRDYKFNVYSGRERIA